MEECLVSKSRPPDCLAVSRSCLGRRRQVVIFTAVALASLFPSFFSVGVSLCVGSIDRTGCVSVSIRSRMELESTGGMCRIY